MARWYSRRTARRGFRTGRIQPISERNSAASPRAAHRAAISYGPSGLLVAEPLAVRGFGVLMLRSRRSVTTSTPCDRTCWSKKATWIPNLRFTDWRTSRFQYCAYSASIHDLLEALLALMLCAGGLCPASAQSATTICCAPAPTNPGCNRMERLFSVSLCRTPPKWNSISKG